MSTQTSSVAAALTSNAFSRSGYTLAGWNTIAGGGGTSYSDGATYAFSTDATLYAQWTAASQTITYNSNGGSGSISATTGNTGASVTLSSGSGFSRSGYAIAKWNTSADGTGSDYTLGASVTMPAGGLTLYAVWGGLPGAPTIGTPTAGSSQVTVTWTAPASNGGSAITDYVVEYSSDAGSTWTTFSDAVSTTTSSIVTGLTNGIAYKFRVSAKNANGTGSASSASVSRTPTGITSACSTGALSGDPYQVDIGGSPSNEV